MIRLPPIVFLFGPEGVGKTTLANLLSDRIPNLLALSFRQPLRDALRGMFFDGNPGVIVEPDTPLPIGGTAGEWLDSLERWVDPAMLATLALQRVEADWDYWSHMVFDDADPRYVGHVKRLVDYFHPENCVVVCMSRGEARSSLALSGAGLRVIDFPNDGNDLRAFVDSFLLHFEATPAAYSEGSALQ